jgi:serine/threonine-protein kinase
VRAAGGHAVSLQHDATGLCLDSNTDSHVYTLGCNQGDNQRWGP